MDTGEPQEETVVFPDWLMLDRLGRTRCHDDLDAAREAVSKNKMAAPVDMDTGYSGYVSFTLEAPPQGVSYLNLHWPAGEVSDDTETPAHASVRATDKDLVLFDVEVPSCRCRYLDAPPDLFVYTAAGPSPSVQQLPLYKTRETREFLRDKFTTGILRLATGDQQDGGYIVAGLRVYRKRKSLRAELCVFNSGTQECRVIHKKPAQRLWDPSNGQLSDLWWTDDVVPFHGRFLCWVDYFSGVLLSDFSDVDSPALHFVPFPVRIEYPDEVRVRRCFPGRYRSVSISQGKMCYVHSDNDFHETIYSDSCRPERPKRSPQQRQLPKKITIWTLNMMLDGRRNSKFEWAVHRVINLEYLWAQGAYEALGIRRHLPEFPIVAADDPDVLCCLLREKEFHGKAWMIMVDMNHGNLRSCIPYINRQSYGAKFVEEVDYGHDFSNIPLLPSVFSKYLEKPTDISDEQYDELLGTTLDNFHGEDNQAQVESVPKKRPRHAKGNGERSDKKKAKKSKDVMSENLVLIRKQELGAYNEDLKTEQIESDEEIKFAQMERRDPSNDPYCMTRCIEYLKQLALLTPIETLKVINYLKKDRVNREILMTVDYGIVMEFLKEVVASQVGSVN